MAPDPDSVAGRYAHGLASGRWQPDEAQLRAIAQLDLLRTVLIEAQAVSAGFFGRLAAKLRAPELIRGIYLHGGVGRGKTFLMDLFFQSLPITEKKRVHFHHFMQQVHSELAALQHVSDPLTQICTRWADDCRVLCFDEFFVSDIGDAMLLSGVLDVLFARGVVLVATSNVAPDGLYQNGLQRARFLPAIALLQQHCAVHLLDSPTDFRLRQLTQAPIYHTPHTPALDAQFADQVRALSSAAPRLDAVLDINGRPLRARAVAGDVAWFSFHTLCETARSPADYIELAREFQTVLISDIPQLDAEREDAARRFVYLVDEFYDRKVNVVISAAVAVTQLYTGTRSVFEFARTQSRLIEMQSHQYLAAAHRG